MTTGYHARRTGYLFNQCLDIDVTAVEVPYVRNPILDAGWVIHETGGLLDTWLRPECD
ncbi:MAG: hypothetical protein ACR2HR_12635 [Euzebya sp.]